MTGALAITATPQSPFVLKLSTLAGTTPGAAANFDPSANYTWVIATATGGVTGFDPADFTIDATNFANATNGGQFALTTANNAVQLTYAPVAAPEPASLGLLALAATGLLTRRRR